MPGRSATGVRHVGVPLILVLLLAAVALPLLADALLVWVAQHIGWVDVND